jgi:serine/threonine protein kinase
MKSIQLTDAFLTHFNVTKYRQASPGGQKTVFIVTIDEKEYALKIIHIADERFEREVKICERFNHIPGIPSILRIEQFDGDTIILEEFIEGNDLSELLPKYKGDEERTMNLIHNIGLILEPVWNDRYVHRDLKPQNIRIRDDGSPVVLDFGIARALDDETITAAGMQPLSWFYASPEQYDGKKQLISYRTDFFCLGILAYVLFTGNFPFGGNPNEIQETFSKPFSIASSGAESIDKLCSALLCFSPADRPRRIETFLEITKL